MICLLFNLIFFLFVYIALHNLNSNVRLCNIEFLYKIKIGLPISFLLPKFVQLNTILLLNGTTNLVFSKYIIYDSQLNFKYSKHSFQWADKL